MKNTDKEDFKKTFKESLTHPKLPKMTSEKIAKTEKAVNDYCKE